MLYIKSKLSAISLHTRLKRTHLSSEVSTGNKIQRVNCSDSFTYVI